MANNDRLDFSGFQKTVCSFLADIAKHDAKLFHINNIRIITENIIYFFQIMHLFLRFLFQIYFPPLQRHYLEL